MEITIEVPDKVGQELLEKYEKKDWRPWRAEKGDVYWVSVLDGVRNCLDVGDSWDNYYYLIGNYFQTKEEACQAGLITQAKSRLRFKMLELNKGWTPDWENNSQDKCFPYYAWEDKKWKVDSYCRFQALNNYHFSSDDLARQFVGEMKADLELVFNINQ